MLHVNHLVGFGGFSAADSGYRYYKLNITATQGSGNPNIREIALRVSTVDQLVTFSSGGVSGSNPYSQGGQTITASNQHGTDVAWRVADDDTGTAWDANSAVPEYLIFDLGAAVTLTDFQMTVNNIFISSICPSAFTLAGSNTGSFAGEEVTLFTESGLTWSSGETKTFTPD